VKPTPQRRRLASFLLLMAVLFLASRYFRAQEKMIPVAIRYLVPADAVELEATLRPQGGGDRVAYFSTKLIKPEVTTQSRLAVGTYEAELRIAFSGAQALTLRRTLIVEREVEVVVDLREERPR
jgi:hypothetical protein